MRRLCSGGRLVPLLILILFGVCRSLPSSAEDASEDLLEYDQIIEPSDREHWSFQPIRQPAIPKVRDTSWPRNVIDTFILEKLESQGWRPAPSVQKHVLLRRIFLDLIGLPPTLAEQKRFLHDSSPNSLELVIDELLSRPGYGERWGRHWLDLVRYAETNGYERDAIKPHAWRYRDYVIAAFNSDKPYNRFVLEQLAGDELFDSNAESMIATGYTRLGPWDDEPADPQQDRSDQMDDLVRTTSRVFLGLTLGCSRCHNHKFDALTMHDYYRMVAIFDPLVRPQQGRQELDLPVGSRTELADVAERDRLITKNQKQIDSLRNSFRNDYLKSGRSELSPEVIAAFRSDPGKQTSEQKNLVEQNAKQLDAELSAALPQETQQTIASIEKAIEQLRRQTSDLPRGYFLHEPTPQAPATHLLLRGRAGSPGPVVQPGVPTVLVSTQPKFPGSDQFTSRRRLSLAMWIVNLQNPLTARVIVNRVWQYHFGQGLVNTPSDFGVLGTEPVHPELLDWLADWFVNDANWSLKKLHRLILTSNTYRMRKVNHPESGTEDPENAYFWRFPYRRLEVETIRDSMLAVSGQLNRKMQGESTYLSVPKEALDGHSDPGKIWKPLDEREASRRTVYAFIKRSMIVPMLEVLDLCDTTRSTAIRNITIVPTQALTLYNGEFVNRQSRHLATRLLREAGDNTSQQIDMAYRLSLCRPPTSSEMKTLQQFLQHEQKQLRQEAKRDNQSMTQKEAEHGALMRLCRVIFNLNEFVYPD
jgi:hypothetical protein